MGNDTNLKSSYEEKIIKIMEGTEHRIKSEKFSEFHTSYFRQVYSDGLKCVNDIVNNTKKFHEKVNNSEDKSEMIGYNNIISFIGERGSGKSSVMISFANALKSLKDERNENFISETKILNKLRFIKLDLIDPSFFEESDSIFEFVIAKMFSDFRQAIEDENKKYNTEEKSSIFNAFREVYNSLKIMSYDKENFFKSEGRYDESVIERLANLATSSNLRENFMKLIKLYLKFSSPKSNTDETFLVISIDDLDMNIKYSCEIVEQIRKYLMIPNVIVLMACKIDQLTSSLETEYLKDYKIYANHKRQAPDNTQIMAERYMDKFIPIERRLYLPEIGEVKGVRLEYFENGSENDNEERGKQKLSIEETVLKRTYDKTGLIFIKPRNGFHYIVPDNFRELKNYLIMMNKMNSLDYDENGELSQQGRKDNLANIIKFEEYFCEVWAKKYLGNDSFIVFNKVRKLSFERRNKYVINEVSKMVKMRIEEKYAHINMGPGESNSSEDFKSEIFDLENKTSNISIGDIFWTFKILHGTDNEDIRKLKFAIKTIYSIELYKATFINENKKENLNFIESFVGGSFFGNLSKGIMNGYESIKFCKYNELKVDDKKNEKIEEIVEKYIETIKEGLVNKDAADSNSGDISEEIKKDMKYIEVFSYFLHYGKIFHEKKYKTRIENYYSMEANHGFLEESISNATYDISAFLFFLINPKKSSRRIYYSAVNKLSFKEGEIESILAGKDVPKNKENAIECILECTEKISLVQELVSWQNKYKFGLPIFSLELVEQVIDRVKFKYLNKRRYNVNEKVQNIIFLESIHEIYQEIIQKNEFLELKDHVKNCYIESPIIKRMLGEVNQNEWNQGIISNLIAQANEKNIKIEVFKNYIEELFKDIIWIEDNFVAGELKGPIFELIDILEHYYKKINEEFGDVYKEEYEEIRVVAEKISSYIEKMYNEGIYIDRAFKEVKDVIKRIMDELGIGNQNNGAKTNGHN